jgi:hypothetical protein
MMRLLIALAFVTLVACDEADHSNAKRPEQAEAAKRHFAQYDQITAFATARPVSGKVRYELLIKNVGSEPLVGLGETSQQWQSLEDDPEDLNEWNEYIPISTDGGGVFEVGPDEEFICVVEPRFRYGVRIRFGFLVFTQVGDDAYRRMRIWTGPRTPESDFATILQPESAKKTKAQQGAPGQPATRSLSK